MKTPGRTRIIVSKRVAKRAVQRNRIRRRVREAIHTLPTALQPPVYVAHPSILGKTFQEIKTFLEHTTKK